MGNQLMAHMTRSVQYLGNQLMPNLIDKIVVGSTVYGLRSSTASPEFQAKISEWTQQLVDAMGPHGMSSFGFLPVRGQPVLTDTHAGSLTTEHFTRVTRARLPHCPPPSPRSRNARGGGGCLTSQHMHAGFLTCAWWPMVVPCCRLFGVPVSSKIAPLPLVVCCPLVLREYR